MISTFDQMSGGRICINLIAGQNESEVEGEGVRYPKEARYELMEEEVSILKALWTTRGPVNFEGKFHKLSGAHIKPRPLQQPFPAARARPGNCRPNIPTCICSGATCRKRSPRILPRSDRWRARTAAKMTSASACGCR